MKEIIIEYITSTFSARCFDVYVIRGKYLGHKMYYDVLSLHLHKMFRLDKYEIDCYLKDWVFETNPDFSWEMYIDETEPTYLIATELIEVQPLPMPNLDPLWYLDVVYNENTLNEGRIN